MRSFSSALLTVAVVALLCCAAVADVPGDLIESVPGFDGKLPAKQYSGFLPADEAKTVFLHYWYTITLPHSALCNPLMPRH
jgi:hypothetical protein